MRQAEQKSLLDPDHQFRRSRLIFKTTITTAITITVPFPLGEAGGPDHHPAHRRRALTLIGAHFDRSRC